MMLDENNPTRGVYIDFSEFMESKGNSLDITPPQFRDIEGMVYLKNVLNLKYFASGPVGILDGVSFVCRSIAFSSMNDLVGKFKNYIDDGKTIIFYDLIFQPQSPEYTELNPTTFEPIPLDNVKMRPTGWRVRFAILGEE